MNRWRRLLAWTPLFGVPLVTTLSPLPAQASASPIDHVVVLMQENRSFDSYLGQLHYEGQPSAEPEPGGTTNPDPTSPLGPPIAAYHKTNYCEVADLNHSWNGAHQEFDDGLMDGFTAANAVAADPTGRRTMGYYDASDLPFDYSLYSTFSTGDHYFSSIMGPTFPNRFYLLAGTSFGHIKNDVGNIRSGFDQPTVFNLLDQAQVSWKIYYSEVPFAFLFAYVRQHASGHVEPISQYYADAANGQLPQVAFVDPAFYAPADFETDEHPSSNVQVGEHFTARIVRSLFASPDWSSSALFLTYDENGGFYDHVPPPAAPIPDAIPPMLQPGDVQAAFDHYGFRVPAVVVSPYSRAHYVSHTVYDHTSILRFIETRFGLPSLTNRDAAANPMLDLFDFTRLTFAQPPSLAPAPLNPIQLLACLSAPPPGGA